MKQIRFFPVLLLVASLAFTLCNDDGGRGFTTVGEKYTLTVGSETINMIYANNQSSITFPFSPTIDTPVDNNPATLTKKFFMSETQVTHAAMAKVLQWAYDNNKFSTTVGDHNGLANSTVKHGGQELLDLSDTESKISFIENPAPGEPNFAIESGYENHPVVCVSWYGAIMFCNWLTEMRDGGTANVVYTGIDTDWDHTETIENADRNGCRLPSTQEWEYAARYIGTTAPSEGALTDEYVAQNHNGGDATLTEGYCWTPADYASGAIKDCTNENETRAVGWYSGDPDMGGSDQLMPVGQKTANQLGLFDMSGNVVEWCFTVSGAGRVVRGSRYEPSASDLQVGSWTAFRLSAAGGYIGFRLAMTQ